MALDNKTVLNIARLARLDLSDKEAKQYSNALSDIFGLIDQLTQVDTNGIEPMSHPLGMTQRLRKDVVNEKDQRHIFQKLSADHDQNLYLVPKVIE